MSLAYLLGESSVIAVDKILQRREDMIKDLKLHLCINQSRMKSQADKHRTNKVFNEGDWVWLKLQPYRQSTMFKRNDQKLSKKYYGHFKILASVGNVAYNL